MKWKTGRMPSGTEAELLTGGPFPVAVIARGRGHSVFAEGGKAHKFNPRGASGRWQKVGWVKGSAQEAKSKVERALAAL